MAVEIKSSGPVVGLDIGSIEVKAVEARASHGAIQLTGLAVAPTPSDLFVQGTIIDPKGLGEFIRQFLAEHKIHAKKVVSAISGQSSVVVRIIEMARMSDQELKDTMKWEVERHVPFSANDLQMDYVVLPTPEGAAESDQLEVLLVAAQNEALNLHLETITAAGLTPIAVDVAPLAVGRALVDAGDPNLRAKSVVVVNIGSATTDISIFQGGTLVFTRPMPLAGESFTNAIADTLGIAPADAEKLKREKGSVLLEQPKAVKKDEISEEPAFEAPVAEEPAQPEGGIFDLSQDQPFGSPDEEPSVPKEEKMADGPKDSYDLSAPFGAPEEPEVLPVAGASETSSVFELGELQDAAVSGGPVVIEPTEEPVEEEPSLEGLSETEQVFMAIEPVLSDFTTELRRSLDYYHQRSGASEIGKIILCGGGSKLPNLDAFLARELGVVTDLTSLDKYIQCTYSNYTAQDLQEALPVIPVSLGLAIRDMVNEEEPRRSEPSKKAKKSEEPAKVENPEQGEMKS